ncbi:MAG: NAD(P)/FAD-dependent oxidoreductase [Betaproteobacteria bacterium]|nr:MAG: NAD(P)/FAD-dependent oxidoreductase [Betaproteobacteria bacterium]
MPAEQVDAVIVGAGVVGLAIARALALGGRETIVLESESTIGTGTSSRNSEVIHAGIYYPPGSLKAKLCVAGRRALYPFLAERGIAHRRCGKLIVATDPGQIQGLEKLHAQAQANGVGDLRMLAAREARALEPQLACVAALESPSTGIVDSHAFMLGLRGEAEDHGVAIAFRSPLLAGHIRQGGIELEVGGAEPMCLLAQTVVNCAGLFAQDVARSIEGFPAERIPPTHYCKGSYFGLSGRSPFSRLVYPAPEAAGLGVHLTLDLAGQARFGPDVEWIERIDYDVDPRRAEVFYKAIRSYWPDLKDGALRPAYSGIRPKMRPRGEPACDFLIQGPADHGVARLVNLFGIESPGLTASLAIGDAVRDLLGD